MRDSAYAYAVARIRANETSLLTASDMDQLITASDLKAALRFLGDKGWCEPDYGRIGAALSKQASDTWQLLTQIAPDRQELEFLVVKNDYHNIKAALKSFVSSKSISDLFITPSLSDPKIIREAIEKRRYEELPEYTRNAVLRTYEILVRTMDGQLADITLDALALDTIRSLADRTENGYIMDFAELICITANIKTAMRAAHTGKDEQFLNTALVETRKLQKSELVAAAAKGNGELLRYLSSTVYQKAAESSRISVAAFEKWCDDLIMSFVVKAKYVSLGVQPLVAYYVAKETEIKNIRIILSCLHNSLPPEMIRERVRVLYA